MPTEHPAPSSAAAGRYDRLLGLLMFLPVPLVLWLFTRAPLGPLPSLGAGVLLVATHRLYARPFALARAHRRCLWCGAAAGLAGVAFQVTEPFGPTSWRACGPAHASAVGGLLVWAQRRTLLLRAGILGTLALFLVVASVAGLGQSGALDHADAVALFRLGIAVTVLPVGWLSGRRSTGREPRLAFLRSPFPLHIQALIGTAAVLWLFRLVGLYWLAAGLLHVLGRAGLA